MTDGVVEMRPMMWPASDQACMEADISLKQMMMRAEVIMP